jgi:hypothetical protein
MASITIAEQETALKPLLAAVSGIKAVFEDWPDEVQIRELPAVIFTPRNATYDERSQGENRFTVRRQWLMLLLVALVEQGREFQSESAAKPFLTTIPDALEAYPRVPVGDGRYFGLELHQGNDEGARPVQYNGKTYIGSVFTFFTVTTTRITPV